MKLSAQIMNLTFGNKQQEVAGFSETTHPAVTKLCAVAQALEQAGCFAILMECLPPLVAAALTQELSVPTIGIGAGPHCSGQVSDLHCQTCPVKRNLFCLS